MSTKLRIAIDVEGVRFFGQQAKSFIKGALPRGTRMPERLHLRPVKERIEWAWERIPYENKKLFLFREPSNVKEKDSKYKQLLKDWGMADLTRQRARQNQRRIGNVTLGVRRPAPRVRNTTPAPAPTPVDRQILFTGTDWTRWWPTDVTITPAPTAHGIDFFGGEQV